MQTDALIRLIEIKKGELESLRKELVLLSGLEQEAHDKYIHALKQKKDFIKETQEIEGKRLLTASTMISHRAFLAHLHQQSLDLEGLLMQVREQLEHARNGLKQAYVEMKSFEMIAKRKSDEKRTKQTRNQFVASDDEELVRFGKLKQSYVEH
jgi:flagellar biosynthesis chaperone FliJ